MIKRTLIAIVLIFLVASIPSARAADETSAQEAAEWRVGVASAKITPEQRLHMAGYAGRKEPAEGTEQAPRAQLEPGTVGFTSDG